MKGRLSYGIESTWYFLISKQRKLSLVVFITRTGRTYVYRQISRQYYKQTDRGSSKNNDSTLHTLKQYVIRSGLSSRLSDGMLPIRFRVVKSRHSIVAFHIHKNICENIQGSKFMRVFIDTTRIHSENMSLRIYQNM